MGGEKMKTGKSSWMGKFSIRKRLIFIVAVAAITPIVLGTLKIRESISETNRLDWLSHGIRGVELIRELRFLMGDHRQMWKTYQKTGGSREALDSLDTAIEAKFSRGAHRTRQRARARLLPLTYH
jgi:hypothetical protein